MHRSLCLGLALATLAAAAAGQMAMPRAADSPPVPAGGVVVPQAALQACAAEGGCILISARRLAAREQGAYMAGMMQAGCRREDRTGVPS